jgi:hypothetical protein
VLADIVPVERVSELVMLPAINGYETLTVVGEIEENVKALEVIAVLVVV